MAPCASDWIYFLESPLERTFAICQEIEKQLVNTLGKN